MAAEYTSHRPLAKENGSVLEAPVKVDGEDPLQAGGRRRVTPSSLAWLVTALVLPAYLVASFAQLLHVGFGLWFVEVCVFLGVSWVVLRFSGRDPARFTGLDAPSLRPISYGFVVGTVNFVAAVVPIQFVATSIAPEWLTRRYDSTRIFDAQGGLDLLLLISAVGIAAPVAEEFFFRGVLQRGLIKEPAQPSGWMKPAAGIALTGFIFSAFHMDPVGLAARWELGVLFGYLAWRSGSIWPGVAAHAANNLISTALYFVARAQPVTADETGWKAVLALGAIGVPLLAAVLLAPRRFGSLLATPKPAADELSAPPRPLVLLAAPWLLAAIISVALVFALDPRGVQLNWIDMVTHPMQALPKNASEADRLARDALLPLRQKARAGELTIAFYSAEREKVARRPVSVSKSPVARDGFVQNEEAVEIVVVTDSPEAAEAMRRAIPKLSETLSAQRLGEVDGVQVEGARLTLHLYGPDADDLLDSARQELGAAGAKGGAVRIRRGAAGSPFSEEKL